MTVTRGAFGALSPSLFQVCSRETRKATLSIQMKALRSRTVFRFKGCLLSVSGLFSVVSVSLYRSCQTALGQACPSWGSPEPVAFASGFPSTSRQSCELCRRFALLGQSPGPRLFESIPPGRRLRRRLAGAFRVPDERQKETY